MFQWTETDVSNLVKFVLQSIRASDNGMSGSLRERLIAAVAAELGASSWHAHFGQITVPVGARSITWSVDAAGKAQDWDVDDLNVAYAELLVRLHQLAQEYGCAWEEISTRDRNAPLSAPHSDLQRVIAWSAVRPGGSCVCVEFCKSASLGEFTQRDEAILRVLSPELLDQTQPDHSENDVASRPEALQLPPRQREVLAALVSGSSVKEIAGELGISPYTVNDYIKAIYRRYKVCSRGELLAEVHGRRKQAVS